MIPPIAIELALKYGKYIVIVLIVIAGYFSWKHHIESVQREKDRAEVAERDAKTARDSAALLAAEKEKVEKSNNEQNARLQNAITIYATRATELNADVDNLVGRLRNNRAAAGCVKDTMPRAADDKQERVQRDNETDHDIARAALELAAMCEMQINKLPVVK